MGVGVGEGVGVVESGGAADSGGGDGSIRFLVGGRFGGGGG